MFQQLLLGRCNSKVNAVNNDECKSKCDNCSITCYWNNQPELKTDSAMAYQEVQKAEPSAAHERVKRVVDSMRDRAADNQQGIKAETLAMFAEELELALRP